MTTTPAVVLAAGIAGIAGVAGTAGDGPATPPAEGRDLASRSVPDLR